MFSCEHTIGLVATMHLSEIIKAGYRYHISVDLEEQNTIAE